MKTWMLVVGLGLMLVCGGCAKKQQEIPNEENITTPTTNDPPIETKPAKGTTDDASTK